MKRIFFCFLCVATIIIFNSCESNDDINNVENNDNYYVKYELSIWYTGKVNYANTDIVVATDNGIQSFVTSSNEFSEIFGPVKKGFEAQMTATKIVDYGGPHCVTSIYVSKNKEPFALKVTKSGGQTSSCSYIIE